MELKQLNGIGDKTEKLFNKLGIYSCEDLVNYYPVHYMEYPSPSLISEAVPDKKIAIVCRVISRPAMKKTARVSIISAKLSDESGTIDAVWFNSAYLISTLKYGSSHVFFGKITVKYGRRTMEQPLIFTKDEYIKLQKTLLPVYPLTKGLSNKTVIKAVRGAFENNIYTNEYLPAGMTNYLGIMSEDDAVHTIHFPINNETAENARRRIAFDEFFLFIMEMKILRSHYDSFKNSFPITEKWEIEELISSLPYKLTNAQMRVWREIESDFASKKLMNRLIQGDVGSGKTIVAFMAMLTACLNGYQAVLMAPTEVLATQHYEGFISLVGEKYPDVKTALLVGSMKQSKKKKLHKDIAEGNVNCIIGTHALIQETVKYKNLGLVVTDEQHRFGVRARKAFNSNDKCPNMIVMSATPIPRTLGLIIYGDLDISIIDEKPAMRLPIKNCSVDTSYRNTAYKFIKSQIDEGRQAYVICPMVEKNEEIDIESVTEYSKTLKAAIPDVRIDTLHGRMRPSEKNKIMQKFSDGETDILVSTTVIEVGIDIPNASVIMIENAERFGLAALHQLRGRVGRGQHQSYCIFVRGDSGDNSGERLDILVKSNDGFDIAEKDFQMRGPGDMLGIRQSGDVRFTLADLSADGDILKMAGDTAASIFEDDPYLLKEENLLLKNRLNCYVEQFDGNIVL